MADGSPLSVAAVPAATTVSVRMSAATAVGVSAAGVPAAFLRALPSDPEARDKFLQAFRAAFGAYGFFVAAHEHFENGGTF